MRIVSVARLSALSAAVSLALFAQAPADPHAGDKGLAPRTAATDYQGQGQAGKFSFGADFSGHSIPTLNGILTADDYVTVEVGVYGPAGEKLKLSVNDFSLKVNGKKTVPSQPYGVLEGQMKDPDYEATLPKPEKESKSGVNRQPGEPEPVVVIPVSVKRSMMQRVIKVAMPEGERILPQAGLLFFPYRGKASGIKSVELLYEGAAGKATIKIPLP